MNTREQHIDYIRANIHRIDEADLVDWAENLRDTLDFTERLRRSLAAEDEKKRRQAECNHEWMVKMGADYPVTRTCAICDKTQRTRARIENPKWTWEWTDGDAGWAVPLPAMGPER